MASTIFYPTSPKDTLAQLYVGKTLHDVPTPAAVINVSATRGNCSRMLEACESLQLGWRAHVKTHKTIELTRLQVGDDPKRPANLVVSTLSEAEFLLPLLEEYKKQERKVNVLYGLPLAPGAVPRLSAIAKTLSHGSISILLDDPNQLDAAARLFKDSGVKPEASIKIDMGGKRAGVVADSDGFTELLEAALTAHKSGFIVLSGLYSHAGHSYGGDRRAAAMRMLNEELTAMLRGAKVVASKAADAGITDLPSLTLSAGASPTALSIQNLTSKTHAVAEEDSEAKTAADALVALFTDIKAASHTVEIHAGVYPTLDLQQLAAHSVSSSLQSWKDIALTVLAEVHSVYPGRGADGTAEMLVGAGGLALGREFCKAYDGMAMVTPWGRPGVQFPECEVEDYQGWIVGRFAQEHGILTWARNSGGGGCGAASSPDVLQTGQKVRLWPNHACITSSHFGWYFVVDEDSDEPDLIRDIWVKARGW